MSWINISGQIYEGDCQSGDREATPEEVLAWRKAITPVRVATPYQLRQAALTLGFRPYLDSLVASLGAKNPSYLDMWLKLDLPETNPKLVRLCAQALPPINLAAWFDAALAG